ncbi:MAG: hypothetical protein OXH93_23450 [Caldilineaceae bacterium]|nr:hypothetical protein [Caldilineaceae bacterium]
MKIKLEDALGRLQAAQGADGTEVGGAARKRYDEERAGVRKSQRV